MGMAMVCVRDVRVAMGQGGVGVRVTVGESLIPRRVLMPMVAIRVVGVVVGVDVG
ncbi:unnamed protein product [Pararhodospirillum photometricum DSM 122]|uniref:Uncharacterized protein n=1 Tax=Pararhodospirillum photometricum DSM 122 TaxID=1150469 RepID=H6SQ64_PARPM|nr:unnamed protein product [Pararhodospirillum photometricum DSM 122]